ncbi:MAG: F0F1 ATP synthase subunit A [Verrucomicrobia bacterium]|nr:F0F1 ATP synthase subunit A [Verrucomicrobiota bacterium]
MLVARTVLTICLFFALSGGVVAAEAAHNQDETSAVHEVQASHTLTPYAIEIANIKGFRITNSMLVTWIVAAGLIVFAQLATRNIRQVPEGAQNFWEWMVESLHEFLEGIIGPELVKRTFWFFATLFIFILFSNWLGLIPGVGTIGWGTTGEHGFHVADPLLRGANADLNMTLAMAMVFFACWTVWALQVNGPGGFIMHIFGPKGDTTGALKLLMIVVFLAVGLLEVVSILFRPVSLSFRLYGNIFAGENMLESMSRLVPGWIGSVVIPIPFYFLEVLVGLVQALVFMLLTAVFTLLICTHEEGHAEGHH